MHPSMTCVIRGKRYSTETATLLAHDRENSWRNAALFRTPRGNYFVVSGASRPSGQDILEPISEAIARDLYDAFPVHAVSWEQAFPHVVVEDA